MIKNTLANIRELINSNEHLDEKEKGQLLEHVEQLHTEICDKEHISRDNFKSIVSYTELVLHESSRKDKNPKLQALSLEGLKTSIAEFESSHPKIFDTVNSIYTMFNKMGL